MKNILYGDGIHDDCPAIQEMLDSGASLVSLPMPDKNYAIASPIRIHSNQELRLDRYTRVCLTDNANGDELITGSGEIKNLTRI